MRFNPHCKDCGQPNKLRGQGRKFCEVCRDAHRVISAHSRNNFAYVQAIKLARGCVDCGFNTNPAALDFDHVRGKKFKGVGAMVNFGKDRIDAEIAKCVVRCANCHRIRTYRRGPS